MDETDPIPRNVVGQPVLADLAAALGLLDGERCGLTLILRCAHVAGRVGLSRFARGVGRKEVGVVEVLALAAEELALEVVELLAEEQHLRLEFLVPGFQLLPCQSAASMASGPPVSKPKTR
jgi:hypothetical protein